MRIEKYGIELKEDFTQAQFEQYQNRLLELTVDVKAMSVVERALVQAASEAGILTGLDKPLAEYTPRVIRYLTIKTRDFIAAQTEIPQD